MSLRIHSQYLAAFANDWIMSTRGEFVQSYLKLESPLLCDSEVLQERQSDSFESVHRQVHVIVRYPRKCQVERGLAASC